MQSLQKFNRALLCAIVASLKTDVRLVAKRTCYTLNLHATFLATPLQHKLQRRLHPVIPAVELDSTLCNDCRDSLKPLQVTGFLKWVFPMLCDKFKKSCIVNRSLSILF